jgi:CTP synthase
MTDTQIKTHYIIVAGGVISGVGKGVTTASIGKILKEHGHNVVLIKIDPYINYDAGTLRPTEHGEVWVTHDGGEIDQDLGTYERFINIDIPKCNNITTGQIYKTVIDRERKGEYLGNTVQFVPHITDEVIDRIQVAAKGYEFAIIEIGGTAGDYENMPFLFAIKALERELGADRFAYVLVTYLPVPGHIGEMKTKPTQQAVRLLGEHGIMPDFIICRSQFPLDQARRKKIEVFAHISSACVIAAPDIQTVYQMPLELESQGLGDKLLRHFKMQSKRIPEWNLWQEYVRCILKPARTITIGIVGKYLDIGDYSLSDSYLSICHALIHAGASFDCGIRIEWIDAKSFEQNPKNAYEKLNKLHGIIIPGGFGESGVEGKITAITYARTHGIPLLGLCYGLQLMAVEFARNVCGLTGAHTTEVNPHTPYPIIDILPMQRTRLDKQEYGGTMRLGVYPAHLDSHSQIFSLYNVAGKVFDGNIVYERHRHRYEVNPTYTEILEKNGLLFSGQFVRQDGTKLMEFIELPVHPFFIGTQAHPEFTSRLGQPSPLFHGFVKASIEYADFSFIVATKKTKAVAQKSSIAGM